MASLLPKSCNLGKPHHKNISVHLGIARLGEGGGLNPCQDGLGHLFRGEYSQVQTGICLILGGQKACQDGLGHFFTEGLPLNIHLYYSFRNIGSRKR